MKENLSDRIIRSRRELVERAPALERTPDAAEGGCGVLGFASNVPIAGRHVFAASRQMHNRGNGKGGGIAMAGLDPAQMRGDAETPRPPHLLRIAAPHPPSRAQGGGRV